MNNGRKQHFLEVYLPNLSSEKLKIPSNFIKHLTGRISGLVSLIGPSGNSWHVHLVEVTGNLYLDDGWTVFVRDHSIEYGDSLVFGYDGNMSFTVQIFDQTSCEKEEAFYCKCSRELSDLSNNLANKRKSEGEAAFSSAFAEKRMRVNWTTDEDLEFGEDFRLKTSSGEGQEHEASYGTYESFEPSEMPFLLALPAKENSQMLIPSMNKRKRKNAVSLETFNKTTMILRRKKNAPGLMKAHSKKKKVHTRINLSIYKKIEERAAQRFTSSFPYFVRFMNYSSVKYNAMNVPVCFSVKHFQDSRFKVTLRNLDGCCWVVNVSRTRHKYCIIHRFSSGWWDFVRDNKIKENDICIFELVAKYEMRVHVSRLGLKGIGNGTQKYSYDNCSVGDDVGSDGLPLKRNKVILKESLVDVNEPRTHDIEGHKAVSEMIPRPHQETKISSMPTRTFNISALQKSINRNRRKDQLLRCNAEVARKIEALSLNSPFPNFTKVMVGSSVGGILTLEIPMKFSSKYLPTYRKEIVLRNFNGECWQVIMRTYFRRTRFTAGGWASFVTQNDLEVGDICFFELVKKWVLQVQVFKSCYRLKDCPSSSDADDDPNNNLSVSIDSV